MDLHELVSVEVDRLLTGLAFGGQHPSFLSKRRLRVANYELSLLNYRFMKNLRMGKEELWPEPKLNEFVSNYLIRDILTLITAIKGNIVAQCMKHFISSDDVTIECNDSTVCDAAYNESEDIPSTVSAPSSSAQPPHHSHSTCCVAKRSHLEDDQQIILTEFIFLIFLGSHKQSSELEYHIVKLVGLCQLQGRLYLLTEKMSRGDLLYAAETPASRIRIGEPVLLPSQWWDAVGGTVKALQHLHNSGVLHRDLCCENVFVRSQDFRGVLGDLSHATFFSKETRNHYPPFPDMYAKNMMRYGHIGSSVIGYRITPHEVLKDTSNVSIASDLYSLGVLMWRLLWDGRTPYPEADDMHQALEYVRCGVSLEFDPSWCHDITTSLRNLLSYDPNRRMKEDISTLYVRLRKHIDAFDTSLFALYERVQSNKKLQ